MQAPSHTHSNAHTHAPTHIHAHTLVVARPPAGLPSLTTLNLSSNRLTGALPPLHGLPCLTHLNLSYNGLTSLQGLHALLSSSTPAPPSAPPIAQTPSPSSSTPHHPLRKLNVKHNLISSAHAFGTLMHFPALQELSLGGNPVCMQPDHRQQLLTLLPQLAVLDDTPSHNISATPDPLSPPPSHPSLPLLPHRPPPPPPPLLPLQQTPQQHAPAGAAAGAASLLAPQLPLPIMHPHQPAHFILPPPAGPPPAYQHQPQQPQVQPPSFGVPFPQRQALYHHHQQQQQQQQALPAFPAQAPSQPALPSSPDHAGRGAAAAGARATTRGPEAPPLNRSKKAQGPMQLSQGTAATAGQSQIETFNE